MTRDYPKTGLTALCSRSHPDPQSEAFLGHFVISDRREAGSSLKFCRVAEGVADVYPRLGPTSEWDTAAAHAVLTAAGGTVSQLDGAPLAYNTRAELLNPHFVAYGPKDRDWLALLT